MADAGKIVITPKGKYNSTTTYEWLDEVTYDGKAYIALKTVTGVTPSDDGVNWRLFLSPNDIVAGNLVPTFKESITRSNIISGENLSTILGKVKKYFTDLKGHAFNDTVKNLTTEDEGSALDASQGNVLQVEVDEINSNLYTLGQGECSGSKNVLDLRGLQEKTINEVTFTPYYDKNGFLKYINVNGTANANTNYVLLDNGVYDFNGMVLRGCPSGGAWDKYNITVIYNQGTSYKGEKSDVGNGVTINNEYTHSQYMICVKSGITVNNLKFYPMIISSVSDNSYEPYFMSNSMLTKDVAEIKNDLSASNAGAHNSVYRGKYLGDALTTEQKAQISAGTFNDLYIGDYWTIGEVNYRIAAFDYWLNSGDTNCTTHHVVIVPDTCLYNAPMNTSNTTTGAYVGSAMYTSNLEQAKTTINNAFGSENILSHREYLANATKSTTDPTYESAGSWYDSTVELMNERMVYGADVFHNIEVNGEIPTNYTIDKSQLPLFALEPSRICNRAGWWLRDVVSAESFAYVNYGGDANRYTASSSGGVRPTFGIKG